MNEPDRQLLVDLRRALLHLHKTLLEWERTAYEKIHGRTSPGALLTALMNDAQFAWLRPLSELIVRIDESLEMDALEGPEVNVDAPACSEASQWASGKWSFSDNFSMEFTCGKVKISR